MTHPENISLETYVVSAGRPAHDHDAPVNTPITLTSTFRGAGTVVSDDRVYARFSNPNWDDFEEVVAGLEGADLPALVFPSGMAAIDSVMNLVPVGSTILIPKHVYMASATLAQDIAKRGICDVVRIDLLNTESVIEAMEIAAANRGTNAENINYSAPKVLLWLESPTNPMLEVAELPVILEAARRLGIVSAVDNTFATPIAQNPLAMGADIVVHSATKYLAGHSDVVMGVTVTSNPELREAMYHHRTVGGAIAGPVETWLALRGIRTLALRVEKSMNNAQYLAEKFTELPGITEVRYPGLPDDPGHQRAASQMRGGFGAILCIVLDATAEETERFLDALHLWTPATSLGGVESLVERRRRHSSEPESIPVSLVRMSVGIENPEDLYQDVVAALASIGK